MLPPPLPVSDHSGRQQHAEPYWHARRSGEQEEANPLPGVLCEFCVAVKDQRPLRVRGELDFARRDPLDDHMVKLQGADVVGVEDVFEVVLQLQGRLA